MPKFTLKVDYPVTLGNPRRNDTMDVAPGATIEVPGVLITSRPTPKDDEPAPPPLPDDAYIVEDRGEERAWAHALWELAEDKPAKAAAVKEK